MTPMDDRWFKYSNCGSFVYFEFGLISEDVYTKEVANTWGILLEHFQAVESIENASILAILRCAAGMEESNTELAHLARIDPGGLTITHRPSDYDDIEYGVPVEVVLRPYMIRPNRSKKFLVFTH
jgi:hypothetical protein